MKAKQMTIIPIYYAIEAGCEVYGVNLCICNSVR